MLQDIGSLLDFNTNLHNCFYNKWDVKQKCQNEQYENITYLHHSLLYNFTLHNSFFTAILLQYYCNVFFFYKPFFSDRLCRLLCKPYEIYYEQEMNVNGYAVLSFLM